MVVSNAFQRDEWESAREPADILRTHTYLIEDPAFHQDVRQEICEHGRAAETAIEVILNRMITTFENSENDLFRQRASDEQILVGATNGEIVVSPSPQTILEGLESASAGLRIMYPMIGSLEDLSFVQRLLAEQCLKARGSEEVRKLVNGSDLTRNRNGNGGAPGRGAAGRGLVMDPGCRMMIDPTDSDLAVVCSGRLVHFWSIPCRDAYFLRR